MDSAAPTPDTNQLWKPEETARFLRISRRHLDNLKDLPRVYLGGSVRFIPEEVVAFLRQNRSLRRRQHDQDPGRSRLGLREGSA